MAATEAGPRVALLARAGEACERIDSALREAGAEIVLVADPMQSAPEQVRDAQPQAILVALDPAIEDAIERYGDVLADPGYMVIFEEAEQAAQRTGWDAARWLRHLSAKLHRHSDVLPAGAEADEVLHPTPGPLRTPVAVVNFEQAIVAVTGEAQQLADDVPRDSGMERVFGQEFAAATVATPVDAAAMVPESVELPDDARDDDRAADEGAGSANDGGDLTADDVAATVDAADDEDTAPSQEYALGTVDVPGSEGIAIAPIALSGDEDAHEEMLSFDPERFQRAGQAGEASGGIEEFLATQGALADDVDADAGTDKPAADEPASIAAAAFDFSGLSLVEDDAAPPPPPPSPAVASDDGQGPAFDLDALGSGLSLADPDSYGHGPKRGAVLIEAGLGGPDAVRQLLAAIPEGFPRPILIRLPLEGGRYDRLVRQMTRATAAPVAVAEPGQVVQPGSIYFVPPGFGMRATPSGWTFDETLPLDPASLFAADESAVLFLSGADAALVAAATGADWTAGLVLAQTPDDGCYDPAAANAAIAAGAGHGAPAALASLLLDRWPIPGEQPNPDPSGMLSP
mgnify:CR=1 FL=1